MRLKIKTKKTKKKVFNIVELKRNEWSVLVHLLERAHADDVAAAITITELEAETLLQDMYEEITKYDY